MGPSPCSSSRAARPQASDVQSKCQGRPKTLSPCNRSMACTVYNCTIQQRFKNKQLKGTEAAARAAATPRHERHLSDKFRKRCLYDKEDKADISACEIDFAHCRELGLVFIKVIKARLLF